MKMLTVPVPSEFSYKLSLEFLERSPQELLHRIEDGNIYKALKIEGEIVPVRISCRNDHLEIDTRGKELSDNAIKLVSQYVREWFDLETDLDAFYKIIGDDDILSPLTKKFRGYRIMGHPDLYESLVWAVLGQQINLKFAYSLKQQFVKEYGKKLILEDKEYYLFPEAPLVAQLKLEDLLKIQFSKQKSRYTIGIAEAFINGTISKEKLRGLPLKEAKDELMKIKGIGNWTANYALMKSFHFPDAFPLEDAGLKNAVRNCLNMDGPPTLAEIETLFLRYKGWEAYATLYFWRSL